MRSARNTAVSVLVALLVSSAASACSSPIVGTDAGVDSAILDVGALDAPAQEDAEDGPSDTPEDAPSLPCTERRWAEPVEVPALNLDESADARLTDDELRLVMNRALLPIEWTRASTSVPFESPRNLNELDPSTTGASFFAPSLSRDGLTLYVAMNASGGEIHLFFATRTRTDGVFSEPVAIGTTDVVGGREFGGSPSPDGIFYWGGASAASYDIYFAPGAAAAIGAPAAVTALNVAAARDESPVVSADGLTIYFASDRADPGAEGFLDVYVATRDAPGSAFSGPRRVPELSGAAFDRPTWISVDQCRMYLDRHSEPGSYSIYYAERVP